MKVTIVKKGQTFGFGKQHLATKDQHHIRGSKEECIDYAKEKKLSLSLHKVTGNMAPANLFYGIAD